MPFFKLPCSGDEQNKKMNNNFVKDSTNTLLEKTPHKVQHMCVNPPRPPPPPPEMLKKQQKHVASFSDN